MKIILNILILVSFIHTVIYAISIEDVKKKANKEGGESLSLKECKIVNSKYSWYNSDGKFYADKKMHCNYVSDIFNKKTKIVPKKIAVLPLEFGKDYKCKSYTQPATYSAMGIKIDGKLSLGRKSMSFSIGAIGMYDTTEFNFIESYNKYHLYRGLDKKGKVVKAKVFTKKGIGKRDVNFEYAGMDFYCTE